MVTPNFQYNAFQMTKPLPPRYHNTHAYTQTTILVFPP